MLHFSESESNRFSMRVFRYKDDAIDPRTLTKEIIAERADLVILRFPEGNRKQLNTLRKMGFPFLVADTLVYYSAKFDRYEPAALRNSDLSFRLYTPADHAIMDEMVGVIFVEYSNHYEANPYLNRDGFLEGYKEWVRGFAEGNTENKTAWFVMKDEKPIGFCACSAIPEKKESEGVIFGVSPEAAGGGVYGDMIRFTQSYFKEHGYDTMKVSTQVDNYAVQKVWAREGFYMTEALYTVHINAFLSHSVLPEVELPFSVSEEKIKEFAEISGDKNVLHLNDDAASSIGFDGRIAHALLTQSEISRYYGMEVPGPGTLFLTCQSQFSAPVYPDRKYSLRFSFPWVNEAKGLYFSVAILRDDNDRICQVTYSDLMLKKISV